MSVAPSAKVRPAADSVKSIQDAPIESVDEVDLTSVEGLRKFQRSFIRQEPKYTPSKTLLIALVHFS